MRKPWRDAPVTPSDPDPLLIIKQDAPAIEALAEEPIVETIQDQSGLDATNEWDLIH